MTEPEQGGAELDDDGPAEDDGVLSVADSLESDDLSDDVLDTGVDAGGGYRASTRFGTTAEEEQRGESLDQLLAEEEPDQGPDAPWTDEDVPSSDGEVRQDRAGRLVADDEGAHDDEEVDEIALDVGRDGGGASAEEAAVHLTEPPRYH